MCCLLRMIFQSALVLVGIVTSRDKNVEMGVWNYTAMDFMHYRLKSSATYKFKSIRQSRLQKESVPI